MKKHNTLGVDLGDRWSHVHVLDGEGQFVEEGRVAMTETAIRNKFGTMPRAVIALEAGGQSAWVSQLLEELGHEVIVSNPARVALIHRSKNKNDRKDAEALAMLAFANPQLLYPIHHRSADARAALQVVRSRDALVQARTALINHARGAVKACGKRLNSCSAEAFAHKVADQIPEALQPALDPVLETIGDLTAKIRAFEKRIGDLCALYSETELMQQIPGVGPLTALTFALTLEDPNRFNKSRDVGAYLGLTPRRDQSGDTDKQLRITKQGNSYLRRLLVNCAHYIIGTFGPPSALRDWALARTSKGGKNARKRTIVAVARKLSVLLHRMWTTGMCYEPYPPLEHQPKLAKMPA
jgi:transposase